MNALGAHTTVRMIPSVKILVAVSLVCVQPDSLTRRVVTASDLTAHSILFPSIKFPKVFVNLVPISN